MSPYLLGLTFAALAIFICILLPSSVASAGPDDRSLSVVGGYSRYLVSDKGANGAILGVEYDRGLSESFFIRGHLSGGAHFGDGNIKTGTAILSVGYVLDVLKYVPSAELGVGAVYFTENDRSDSAVEPMIRIGLGFDILTSRSYSYGTFVRFDSFLSDSGVFTAGFRGSYRWGFF